MARTVLVVGGTGPTGRAIVEQLLARGDRVTIYHTGAHEVPFSGPVEHVHGDPRSLEALQADLGGRTFDVVVSTSGRLRYVASVVAGRTGKLVGITGQIVYAGFYDEPGMVGRPVPVPEDAPLIAESGPPPLDYFVKVVRSERAVLALFETGQLDVTLLRYPVVYGPYAARPFEWFIVKRVLDRRPVYLLEGDGLTLVHRGYTENLAHAALLALENPRATGQVYNVADLGILTHRAIVETIAGALGHQWEYVEVPRSLGPALDPFARFRNMVADLHKVRSELGYADRVDVVEATRRTAIWLAEHPPASAEAAGFSDAAFDYALEDRVIAAARAALAAGRAVLRGNPAVA